VKLDAYTVVFLRRPSDAPQLSDKELDELQREHIAFNARMREEGHAVLTGPLSGQPDQSLRGINVFRTSVEETRRLMDQDPSVQAGRLAVDVFTWYLPEGLLGGRPAAQITEE
jgi:uncharacterized protein